MTVGGSGGAGADPGLDVFEAHRRRLFGVAYRMLGSVTEAEDVVQDTWLRWAGADRAEVREPAAWLTTTATRLALDRLRSAWHRRESYVGPWLAEPLVTTGDEPGAAAELADSVTSAFLRLLERLNPLERAAFLLHEVFGYRYEEVAEVVGRPASTCRQLASRGKAKLAEARPRYVATPEEELRLVSAFALAASTGDLPALTAVLSADVVLWTDGGAHHAAARRPVVGPARVARFLANVTPRIPAGATITATRLNGEPALVVRTDEGPYLTLAFELGPDGIRAVHSVRNPEKLRHLA